MAKTTMVTVTVKYEVEYDGEVTEADIDVNDVIRNLDAIKDIQVKTWNFQGMWRSPFEKWVKVRS